MNPEPPNKNVILKAEGKGLKYLQIQKFAVGRHCL